MVRSIGLLDLDAIYRKRYEAPNYDLGVTYAYFSGDRNVNVRLVTSVSEANLSSYDEIYIFKIAKWIPHPSVIIEDYYNYQISEFGPGFRDRELRPFCLETRYMAPNFKCYNNMLRFSIENPKHYRAWTIFPKIKQKKFQQLRLFEEIDGEWLRKDISTNNRNIVVHDDPNILLSNPEQWNAIVELIDKKYRVIFAQALDISLFKDTIIIGRVLTDSGFSSLRKWLYASEINANLSTWMDCYFDNTHKTINVKVLFVGGKSQDYYLANMLKMHYYNWKSGYALRMKPLFTDGAPRLPGLALFLFRYLYQTPYLMSFYEYVFNIGCLKHGVPKGLIKTGEERYELILSKYGMPPIVVSLEQWILEHKEYEEHIFKGGDSDYKEVRKKSYDAKKDKYAFNVS